MFKSLFSSIVILAVAGNVLFSQDYSFMLLRNNMSARAAGLSGSFEAMADDPNTLFFNPAAISTVTKKNFSATFFKHVLDINSGLVTYIRDFEGIGRLAGSVNFTSYGSFDAADKYGNITGSFSASDLVFGVTYSNELDSNLYWGATAKFVFVTLEKASSVAFAVDAGLIYRIPEKRLNIGFSVLHAGAQISRFGDISESLPLDVRIGLNHALRGLPLLLNVSLHHLADNEDNFFDRFLNFSIGGEFSFGKNVEVRIGYDNSIRQNSAPDFDKKLSGFSGGLGLKFEDFNFDYGLAQISSYAYFHRFSLALGL